MPRTTATTRSAATTRTAASARSAIGAFHLPQALIDLGVSHLWDFRTAKLGTNDGRVIDLIGGLTMRFAGTSALSAVYPTATYSADLERNNSDYFKTMPKVLQNGATAITVFMWVNRESISSVQQLFTQWETTGNMRSFKASVLASNLLDFQLSLDGTTTTAQYTTVESFTDSTNNHLLRFNYDLTNRCQIFVDEVAQTVGLTGSHPASIFSGATPVLIGCQIPSAPANFWDGIDMMVGICLNKSLSTAEGAYLYQLTNALGSYV